jgi:hypothetical protein
VSDYVEMSSEIKEKSLYELNNDGILRTLDSYSKNLDNKTSKLTNKNEDAVDEAIVPKMMISRAPSTEQYMDMDHGQKRIMNLK